jgi:transcriptional activator SPT7
LPEAKLTDPFYDALEGLLLDLKTVTVVRPVSESFGYAYKFVQDNRDAEAFLKPVSKAEVPDYYDCTYAQLS